MYLMPLNCTLKNGYNGVFYHHTQRNSWPTASLEHCVPALHGRHLLGPSPHGSTLGFLPLLSASCPPVFARPFVPLKQEDESSEVPGHRSLPHPGRGQLSSHARTRPTHPSPSSPSSPSHLSSGPARAPPSTKAVGRAQDTRAPSSAAPRGGPPSAAPPRTHRCSIHSGPLLHEASTGTKSKKQALEQEVVKQGGLGGPTRGVEAHRSGAPAEPQQRGW